MKNIGNEEKRCQLSILLGSINPYSYLGHSQRMFSLAHYFVKHGLKVTWMNSPSFAFWHNVKFITNGNVSTYLYPFFFVGKDEIAKDLFVSVYDSWAPPKYDKFAVSFYVARILQRIYSTVFSGSQLFDVFFFDSPIFADLAVRLKKRQNTLIIYDSPDDYFAYSEIGESFKQSERDVAIVADIIITPTESIRSKILSRNKGKLNVRVIPNGVPRAEIARVPNMRKSEAVPRIGFIGTLASWVDFNLIFDVATRMPNCEFVVAGDGPNYSNWKQKSPSNCKFIGRVSMAKRHEIISSFDVGLIPFKRVSLADSAFPLKLLEYFARGVSVVSSPLVETKNIAEGFAYFADNVDVWVAQINNALNDSFETKMSYIEFASKYTWENTADLLLNAASEYLTSG